MIDPYKPAIATEFGTAIKAIPTYIFVRFAAVSQTVEVLFLRALASKCLSENLESVYSGHLSDGDEEGGGPSLI